MTRSPSTDQSSRQSRTQPRAGLVQPGAAARRGGSCIEAGKIPEECNDIINSKKGRAEIKTPERESESARCRFGSLHETALDQGFSSLLQGPLEGFRNPARSSPL